MNQTTAGKIWVPMGGVCVEYYSPPFVHSIITLEAESMLADLLLLLRTDEEREQFAQFYLQYEKLMYKTARQILDSQQDCEDVVQVSCTYLIDHFEKFSSYEVRQVAAYVVLLIRSRAKDIRNRQGRVIYEDIENYAEVIEMKHEDNPNLLLDNSFEQLPEHYREALTLYYYNGLSIKEVAALLKLSESATKKLLQRSRDTLRNIIIAEGGENV